MEQTEQQMEVDYESDGDTIMNEADSIASSISIDDDAMDGHVSVYGDYDENLTANDENLTVDIRLLRNDEMTGILYPQQLTLTVHLVQEADGSWSRTVE